MKADISGYNAWSTSKHYHISHTNFSLTVFTYTRTIRGFDCDLSLGVAATFSHSHPQSLSCHIATIVFHYPHKQWSIDSIALSMYSHLIVYVNNA